MDKRSSSFTPEIWGGVECSYNRVGDLFMDQLDYCGHYERAEEDIARFASLGIRAIRYPVIWEKHQRTSEGQIDFSWIRGQLSACRKYGMKPIAGLMHHGNGPLFTNLMSHSFAGSFASYASAVAKEFPWLEYYTPVNEPLTTARFGGLYGIWYPHHKSARDFAIILLNQMKATVLAMREIRKINSDAKLVQTEDLCKTYSTPLLQYQADFENERRWLTFDILTGRLKPGHALWDYFQWLKVPEQLLNFFQDNFCPPDIVGADHYLTSERFLDENLQRYPGYKHGGNGRHRYADVEAIRVNHPKPWGLKMLLGELWERYHLPIAVTEVHINGTSDDQIRWFREVWDIALSLADQGIDIRAVTAWALLGSYGWSNLLTMPRGHYEVGAFDLRNGAPEATVFADFLRDLSVNPEATHASLSEKGWWQQSSRCFYNVDPFCKDVVEPIAGQM